MKKIALSLTVITILGSTIINTANAQEEVARLDGKRASSSKTKELMVTAQKSFNRQFRNAGAAWSAKDDGYRARFSKASVQYMVDYDVNGNWVSTIKNYDESTLDRRVADAVKTAFLGYAIVHVTEVQKGKTTVYLVKIDDGKSLKTVRMIDGEMDVIESYKNAK